jgi:predicted N-acetyltransferase YhbS
MPMDQEPLQELFLAGEPAWEQRWQALCLNMQAWVERWALVSGGEVAHEGGMMWTYTPMGESHITIPSLDALQDGEQVDRILDWYRQRRPLHGGLCWYLDAADPGDLGVRLFARGFEPNWQPHWMWLELRHLQKHHVRSATFDIRIVEDEAEWRVDDLPYYNAEEAAIIATLRRTHPRYVWHLAAFQGQQVVGRCVLNVTSGESGVAGLFSMGVMPIARRQGIGTALVQEACELAEQLGCQHVVLNATLMGEPVYRRVGFQSMGYGHTWYLGTRTLAAPAPAKERVAFMEAIGRGDISALDEMSKHLEKEAINEPLPSGLTALDISVSCQQHTSADWLVEHGTQLDLVSAWDLGWKERISVLLAEQPELVNVQRGDWQLTPLHVAVQRNDVEFAKLLFTVPHDLEIKDTQFHATALGWAQHFQQREMITLIEEYQARQRKL